MTKKRKLTRDEEFHIMSLILDKFLWAGLFILLFGFYISVVRMNVSAGMWIMASGGIILLLLMGLLVKEYEFSH